MALSTQHGTPWALLGTWLWSIAWRPDGVPSVLAPHSVKCSEHAQGGSPALRPLTILSLISPHRKTGVQVLSFNLFSQMGCSQGPDSMTFCGSALPLYLAQSEEFYQSLSLPYCDARSLGLPIQGKDFCKARVPGLTSPWTCSQPLPGILSLGTSLLHL